MARMGEPQDELDAEDELVVTDHRDQTEALVPADEEESMETTVEEGSEVLEEFGEDVSSSPAERGRTDETSHDADTRH